MSILNSQNRQNNISSIKRKKNVILKYLKSTPKF